MDFYPTTVELLGLALPADEKLDGSSFASIFSRSPTWSGQVAFSQHPRCWQKPHNAVPVAGTPWVSAGSWECLSTDRASITCMGMTMRTRDWRYTEWRLWQGHTLSADWSESGLLALELYNHTGNRGVGSSAFDEFEFVNLGYLPSVASERATLAAALKTQFNDAEARSGMMGRP
eukprot:SAG11_NODE_2350_length_3483_cov_3.342494_4_plen_175_part_00